MTTPSFGPKEQPPAMYKFKYGEVILQHVELHQETVTASSVSTAIMLPSLLFTSIALALPVLGQTPCTRDFLKAATAEYLDALTAGEPTFSTLSSDVDYYENDALVNITTGVLSQGIKIDFNLSIYDTTQCASYTEIVATTEHPYVIGTRLAFTDSKVTHIDSIVCDTGDWLFNATGSLIYNRQESWAPVPVEKRESREALKAAGDAYIDAWGNHTVKPVFAKNCARLEGGFYITSNCLLNFPPPFNVSNQRYTIDEELGAVDIFHLFPFLDAAIPRHPGTQTNNLIRVESGEIRYIHENTVCSTRNCGR
ncbi:hypothetical protein QC764_502290 [Podospora pseudoanserina]|uniref:DUF8021 domain-containing protein n=1 Tax=Podospora pseudoanserina TaxID=2609844 RepID=A0ABR0I498_9PEZI|nr:hypothetical protein QC764_502290 [Podospora pseudoanserina]